MDVEPVKKKLKSEQKPNEDDCINIFLKHQQCTKLNNASLALKINIFLGFRTTTFVKTNIDWPCSFSQAMIMVSAERTPYSQYFFFSDVFKHGFTILSEFFKADLETKTISAKFPDDVERRNALIILLKYFNQIEKDSKVLLTANKSREKESNWTLLLAQHLFSKLTSTGHYFYDVSEEGESTEYCPCEDHEELHGSKHDTSFGWSDSWHGKTDVILMTDDSDVAILNIGGDGDFIKRAPSTSSLSSNSSDQSEYENNLDSGIEVEISETFSKSELCRVYAETIAFSFLKNKEKSNVSLIPLIAVGRKKVSIVLYDSESDICLQGNAVPLFNDDLTSLNTEAIVMIWLAINYKLFCSGALDKMETSGLHKLIDVEKFKEDVKAPCRPNDDVEDWHWKYQWLQC